MRNTKKQGKFILFVYQEKPNYYIGVNLNFDLIQEGKTPEETMQRLKDASLNYLKTIIKKNYPDDLLNKPAPKEYWIKFEKFLKREVKEIKKRTETLKKELEEKKRKYWETYLQEQIYTPNFLKKELNV